MPSSAVSEISPAPEKFQPGGGERRRGGLMTRRARARRGAQVLPRDRGGTAVLGFKYAEPRELRS